MQTIAKKTEDLIAVSHLAIARRQNGLSTMNDASKPG